MLDIGLDNELTKPMSLKFRYHGHGVNGDGTSSLLMADLTGLAAEPLPILGAGHIGVCDAVAQSFGGNDAGEEHVLCTVLAARLDVVGGG